MPQFDSVNGRWIRAVDAPLHPSAARTTTGNGTVEQDMADATTLRLLLAVTAVAGTNPTLDVKVQTRESTSGTWRDLPAQGAFAQKTGVSTEQKVFTGCDRYVRIVYTIGGTGSPSFTFSVTGSAV
jgi:hypothetical protein